MPTAIRFTGAELRVVVDEDPPEVQEKFRAAGGLPFVLTDRSHRNDIWINPLAVAYWIPYLV